MQYTVYTFLFFITLTAACNSRPSTPESQVSDSAAHHTPTDSLSFAKSSGNPDVDSILLDYDIGDQIILIEKRYAEDAAQYAFILPRTNTRFHQGLVRLFEFNDMQLKEYEATYNRSIADSLVTVAPPSELVAQWIPVFWYNNKPYVVSPCETYKRFTVTDSSFVRWCADGVSAEPIVSVKKEGNGIAFETAGEREYRLILRDPQNSIYQLSGHETAYVIPLAKASQLPIIIEHCTVDGGISVDYDFSPPTDRH